MFQSSFWAAIQTNQLIDWISNLLKKNMADYNKLQLVIPTVQAEQELRLLLLLIWPRNLAQFEVPQSSARYLFLAHLFSLTSENISTNHILPKIKLVWLHLNRRQHGPNYNDCNIIGPRCADVCKIMQNNNHYVIQGNNFGTSGKPKCNFLCANNTNLPPILHHFGNMVNYFFNFCPRQKGVSL